MKYEIISVFNGVDSFLTDLNSVQIMYPGYSREISHLIPGQRLRVSNISVVYCLLDTEIKDYYEL